MWKKKLHSWWESPLAWKIGAGIVGVIVWIHLVFSVEGPRHRFYPYSDQIMDTCLPEDYSLLWSVAIGFIAYLVGSFYGGSRGEARGYHRGYRDANDGKEFDLRYGIVEP